MFAIEALDSIVLDTLRELNHLGYSPAICNAILNMAIASKQAARKETTH